MKKVIILGGIILLVVIIWLGVKYLAGSNNPVTYRLSQVEKGDIIQTVKATGTVQPIKLISVGTQVTGPIKRLYADFNSPVKEGEIVAQIDPAVYEARVAQNRANLIKSRAEVERVKANLALAEKELIRSQELAKRDLISQSELDAAIANYDSISAQLKVALAQVQQNESALQLSEVDLAYTTIRSPVDGVVISRNVNEGQTVVASLSAQTIFIIATDLKQIQIEASIPEADIGKVQEGQPVTFTVDAYPEIEFTGVVTQVRLAATTVQNVVTYAVIISAENPEKKLFPGMTANLTIEVARRTNVLKVPNAALRFTPDATLVEGSGSITSDDGVEISPTGSGSSIDRGTPTASSGMRPGEHGEGDTKPRPKIGLRRGKIWVQTERKLLKSIPVITGISDGYFTEVISNQLKEGQEIVTGTIKKDEAAEIVNPFMPRHPGMRRH